jgi:hypothetical protein
MDDGLARLARALNERDEPERCRWPLGTCAYPAVLDGLCGFHQGQQIHDRDTSLKARADAVRTYTETRREK